MAIITLLSDLGNRDASAGIARGVLSQYVPAHSIADITHDIPPFQMQEAAYVLGAAYKSFPKGSVHVVLFDIFAGTSPRLVLSEEGGHYFLAPDNGLLPLALGKIPVNSWLCMELTKGGLTDWLHAAGNIAHQLATKTPKELQLSACQLQGKPYPDRFPTATFTCDILHTDDYENVVLDVTRDEFAAAGMGRPFRLEFTQVEELTAMSSDYRDVRAGYKLCRFNSNGYLEICINKGKAGSLLGLKKGSIKNDIKLIFE